LQKQLIASLFLVVIIANNGNATDWLCTGTASTRHGKVYTVCGVGEALSLQIARDKSLESAQREFRSLCQASTDCRSYEAIARPMRTECRQRDDIYSCYRAVEFKITNISKKDIEVDLVSIKAKVAEKEIELTSLRGMLRAKKRLHSIEQNLQLAKAELELSQLQEKQSPARALESGYSVKRYKTHVDLGFNASQIAVGDKSVVGLGFSIALERTLIDDLVGLRVSWQNSTEPKADSLEDQPNTGPPSTSTIFDTGVDSSSFSLSIPFYLSSWYVGPTIGRSSIKFDRKTIEFGIIGIANTTNVENIKSKTNYYGAEFGYVSKPDYYSGLGWRVSGDVTKHEGQGEVLASVMAGFIFKF